MKLLPDKRQFVCSFDWVINENEFIQFSAIDTVTSCYASLAACEMVRDVSYVIKTDEKYQAVSTLVCQFMEYTHYIITAD